MMVPLLDPVDGGVAGTVSAAESTNDELILAELWISFVSLLRSHLGALQTTGKLAQAVFTQLTPSAIEVADLSRVLHLDVQMTSGSGEWSLTRLGEMIAAGDWRLYGDATVIIDGGAPQDMELAVEEFTRRLWTKASAERTTL